MNGTDVLVQTTSYKCIYIIEINDAPHRGLLKIGDATVHTTLPVDKLFPNSRSLNAAANERIKSYTNTAGISYRLLHTELAVFQKRKDGVVMLKGFRDHDVHDVLISSGIDKVKVGNTTGQEWFEVDLATAIKAIEAVKKGEPNLVGTNGVRRTPIVFRPEQETAIEQTCQRFKVANRMLWNAKMRFGKTLSALEVVRRMHFEKTIILTHRPVVDKGWGEDFRKLFPSGTEYRYGSKGAGTNLKYLLQRGKPFIFFASLQDLRGSKKVGGKFEKNDDVFKTVWDFVIIDEAHEGTQTSLGDDTVKAVIKTGRKEAKTLYLSGTPFNLLKDFEDGEVYTWDYVMEQRAKRDWWKNHFGDSNPYEGLPELRMLTYDLGDVFVNQRYSGEDDIAFNFREFFRTWTGDFKRDFADMPVNARTGDFVHVDDVRSFLNLMTTASGDSAYPFSTEEYRDMFRHSLWMVPGVKEARALSSLMRSHSVFGSGAFEIVNVAGKGDEEEQGEEALRKVLSAIKRANKTGGYTITLSCGRLTTGVTVREWSAVLMLSGTYSTSASNYLQTIFRVQSPGQIDGKMKETAYVFDFAPDRTLKMVAEAVKASARPGKTSEEDRKRLGAFLNFCPVIGVAGSKMTRYDTGMLLQQMKRAYADRVVRSGFEDQNLYSDELYKLTDGDLSAFEGLKKIVGASKPSKNVDEVTINDQGLTDEEYEKLEAIRKKKPKERTEEEKELLAKRQEAKKNRDKAISILRQVSIRMPLLIYGADIEYDSDITLDRFVHLVDDASWVEFMPKGVTKAEFAKFRRFYDEDVFIAAGHRIRDLAHQADTLEPTERVMKIAALFSYFKNPDKETVLTPWRVVNMHMSDCLGGWDFFDDNHEEVINQPRFVNRGDITQRVFVEKDTRILEFNSKTGLYPLYVAYSSYRSRMVDDAHLDDNAKRLLWMKTVSENVFVVCKTPMAKSITKRTLIGYQRGKVNAHYFDDLLGMLRHKPQQLVDKIRRPRYWGIGGEQIVFSAVVGNPPYAQIDQGNRNSATSVFQDFVQGAIRINPQYVSMITPSRWFSGGKGLDDFRTAMLGDRRLRSLTDYVDSNDCFEGVAIAGGVSYFLWDREYDGECCVKTVRGDKTITATRNLGEFDIFIRNNGALRLIRTILASDERRMDAVVGSRNTFGITTDEAGSDKMERRDYLRLARSQKGNQMVFKYIDPAKVSKEEALIEKYKVVIGRSVPRNGEVGVDPKVGYRAITTVHIFGPKIVFTDTYLLLAAFDTLQEAENFAFYMTQKFPRFLLHETYSSMAISKDNFRFVPYLDYSHRWSDDDLFERYSCSQQERDMIDSMIRPLEYVTHTV